MAEWIACRTRLLSVQLPTEGGHVTPSTLAHLLSSPDNVAALCTYLMFFQRLPMLATAPDVDASGPVTPSPSGGPVSPSPSGGPVSPSRADAGLDDTQRAHAQHLLASLLDVTNDVRHRCVVQTQEGSRSGHLGRGRLGAMPVDHAETVVASCNRRVGVFGRLSPLHFHRSTCCTCVLNCQ